MSDITYQLIIRKGPKSGHIYTLSAPILTLGRDPMSDITLNDPEVSRYHAQFMETMDGYQIQDMGSTNGTFIDGQRIGSDPIALTPGTEITFGSGIIVSFEKEGNDDGDLFAATMVDTAGDDWEEMVARSEEAAYKMDSPPPPLPSPSPPAPSGPLPQPSPPLISGDDEAARKKKRNTTIIVASIVLVCCCCAFSIYAMYQWGGDYVLKEMESLLTPTFTP